MIESLILLLIAGSDTLGSQELYIQPADCSEFTPARLVDQNLGEITPGSGYQICPPEDRARHTYHFNGFEGERVAFWLSHASPSSSTDNPLDLSLSITGPNGYRAGGKVSHAGILLALPRTGRYELVVQNHAFPGTSRSPYSIDATEFEARSPDSYSDCSRLSLPGAEAGLDINPHFIRPGGSVAVRPVWRMRGRTYDAYPGCFTDWNTSSDQARLTRNRVGDWVLIIDPSTPTNTAIRVTARAGTHRATNSVTVETVESDQ